MKTVREKQIGNYLIEEFYWGGRDFVYVNDKLRLDNNFETICQQFEKNNPANENNKILQKGSFKRL